MQQDLPQDVAIKVSNLSKCYHIYEKPNDRLKQFVLPKLCALIPPLRKLFPSPHSSLPHHSPVFYNEFWALKDVSFEIKKGETVGIIGRNGSGKSTLLQIICGTLSPTSGNVKTNGRIAALLELGSGFNPEFTGRENVYLNAAVLGLSQQEIDERFEGISAFADIGEFIMQPVKTYSSGMVVRLAFAVAINVDPEILIIDEALSVGDELFQRKCFSRIEAIKEKGATILFVSHSGAQIAELCDRAMLLDMGEKLTIGAPKKIVGLYQKLLYAPTGKSKEIREEVRKDECFLAISSVSNDHLAHEKLAQPVLIQESRESFDENLKPTSTIKYEALGAIIGHACVQTLQGKQVNNLVRGETYQFTYTVTFTQAATNVHFAMLIKTVSGLELGGGVTASAPRNSLSLIEAGINYRIKFRFNCTLNPGVYFLNCGVVGDINGVQTYLHRLIDIAMFRVMPISGNLATAIIDFGCVPVIERLHTATEKQENI